MAPEPLSTAKRVHKNNPELEKEKEQKWHYPAPPETDQQKFKLHYGSKTKIYKKAGSRKFKASSLYILKPH